MTAKTQDTKNSYRRTRSPKHVRLHDSVISRCCFVEDGKEMYKDSKRTSTATVCSLNLLLGDVLVAVYRRGLLKLPIREDAEDDA